MIGDAMGHLIENRGQDCYCHRCGKSWDVSEVMPTCEQMHQPSMVIELKAFLVGAASPGCNPCLVFAPDAESAVGAVSRPLGIHPSDLVAVAAPKIKMQGAKSDKPYWVIAPHQLEVATRVCSALLYQNFPGADRVVNPFKMTKRK